VLAITCLLFACSHSRYPADSRERLVGDYELSVGTDCKDLNIQKARLVLHSDGTFSQYFKWADGRSYSAEGNRWSFDADSGLFLFNFKDFTYRATSGLNKQGRVFGPIVEFSDQIILLLNPDKNCFYRKVR
jgi:hypothetical protein